MLLRYIKFLPIVVLFACGSGVAEGQPAESREIPVEGDAPSHVLEAFAQKYPGAADTDWRRDRNDSHEAHFTFNGERMRADFEPSGTWIETEISVKWDNLPEVVQDAIKADYDKDDIVEMEFTDNAEKGKFYDIEIDPKGEKKFDVEYRVDGTKM